MIILWLPSFWLFFWLLFLRWLLVHRRLLLRRWWLLRWWSSQFWIWFGFWLWLWFCLCLWTFLLALFALLLLPNLKVYGFDVVPHVLALRIRESLWRLGELWWRSTLGLYVDNINSTGALPWGTVLILPPNSRLFGLPWRPWHACHARYHAACPIVTLSLTFKPLLEGIDLLF